MAPSFLSSAGNLSLTMLQGTFSSPTHPILVKQSARVLNSGSSGLGQAGNTLVTELAVLTVFFFFCCFAPGLLAIVSLRPVRNPNRKRSSPLFHSLSDLTSYGNQPDRDTRIKERQQEQGRQEEGKEREREIRETDGHPGTRRQKMRYPGSDALFVPVRSADRHDDVSGWIAFRMAACPASGLVPDFRLDLLAGYGF